MIWPILEARAEIEKYFHSFFGSNEDIQKSFWNYLTVRFKKIRDIQILHRFSEIGIFYILFYADFLCILHLFLGFFSDLMQHGPQELHSSFHGTKSRATRGLAVFEKISWNRKMRHNKDVGYIVLLGGR